MITVIISVYCFLLCVCMKFREKKIQLKEVKKYKQYLERNKSFPLSLKSFILILSMRVVCENEEDERMNPAFLFSLLGGGNSSSGSLFFLINTFKVFFFLFYFWFLIEWELSWPLDFIAFSLFELWSTFIFFFYRISLFLCYNSDLVCPWESFI